MFIIPPVATLAERQRYALQRRWTAAGLCKDCGEKKAVAQSCCITHLAVRELSTAGLISEKPTDRKKRLLFGQAIERRYKAILNGEAEVKTAEATIKDAYAIRRRLHVHWGGAEGLLKMAKIISRFEHMAEKHRKQASHKSTEFSTYAQEGA